MRRKLLDLTGEGDRDGVSMVSGFEWSAHGLGGGECSQRRFARYRHHQPPRTSHPALIAPAQEGR
jgi:hypothetical protein